MTEIRHPNENLISYTKADLKLCDSHMTKWFFLNQERGRLPLDTTQQPPDFSEIVCEEAVFHRISVMG